MTSPAAATRLDEIRERQKVFEARHVTGYDFHKHQRTLCIGCNTTWPCDAATAAREDVPFLLAQIERLRGALEWIVQTDPPLGAWDGWRFVTQIRNYALTALQTDDPRARALLGAPETREGEKP